MSSVRIVSTGSACTISRLSLPAGDVGVPHSDRCFINRDEWVPIRSVRLDPPESVYTARPHLSTVSCGASNPSYTASHNGTAVT